MDIQTINIKDYLHRKGIIFKESYDELISRCIFNDCDKDSRPNEAHLYFSASTGQYQCKKCDTTGNIFTLAKFLGDEIKDLVVEDKLKLQVSKTRKRIILDEELVENCHRQIPDNIRLYLNQRGITDDLIDLHKIGYGKFYYHYWITVPIKDKEGKYLFFKLRRDPNVSPDINPHKYKVFPMGSKAAIFGIENINGNEYKLLFCEGEFDQIIASSKGIPSVSSTAGAGTFKEEWFDDLPNFKKYYVGYDNDEEGKEGANELIAKLKNKYPLAEVFNINFESKVKEKGDISDFFLNGGTVNELFNLAKKIEKTTTIKDRIVHVPMPQRLLSFEELKQIIKDNFPELVFAAELGLSILGQILITDITNPFAIVIVDVPSAGKTIAINFYIDIKGLIYATDKFSPASFVSNAANVKKEKLAEVDLLPRIKNKMFLIRDFATLFSKREEDLTELLGILTRVLDGEGLTTDTGVHGRREYEGEYLFMILAASTPIPPRVWKVMGNLGSRLFFYNINSQDKSEEQLAHQLGSASYKEKEYICRIAMRDYAYKLWNQHRNGIVWDKTKDEKEIKLIIARCAKLLAQLRGVINVWYSDELGSYTYSLPLIEKPDRINQLLYNLGRGHAVISGREYLNKDDLKVIIEIALDSAPITRSKVFKLLLDKNGVLRSTDIEIALKSSDTTALKEIETLKILGLGYTIDDETSQPGRPAKILKLHSVFQWFLSDEFKELRGMPLPSKQDTLSF